MDLAKTKYKTKKDRYITSWSNASDNAFDKARKQTYDASRKMGMSKRKSEKRATKASIAAATAAEYNIINKMGPGVKNAKKEYKLAKKEYKKERKKTNENYDKKKRVIDTLAYNSATKKKINKLMNNGMSMTEARKKVHKEAWRNTTILAGIGTAYIVGNKIVRR